MDAYPPDIKVGIIMNEFGESSVYRKLDRPDVLRVIFHPGPEFPGSGASHDEKELAIPVDKGISIGARLHLTGKSAANILFFHGNGEIVADYDDIGPLYNRTGINFIPVDYRGYGRSGGTPTVFHMMKDAHVILDFIRNWLTENGHTGPLIIMGRSLGSAPALELASKRKEAVDGLIVESGFADVKPLLRLLGVNPDHLGLADGEGFGNVDKMRKFDKPTLVIHAERDHIISFSEGRTLFDASVARDKYFLKVKNADHNNIMLMDLDGYMHAVRGLTNKIMETD